VTSITVDYGSRVRRGDVLIELSIPELTDELHQAEATLNARRARMQSLVARVSEAALLVDSAKAEEQRYAAEQNLANITLGRKTELLQGKAIPPQEFDVARNTADLAKAQVAVGRAKTAGAQGALASAQADAKSAEADVGVAQADVSRIKTLLGYSRVTAPFDGVITRRNVNHGTFVRSAAQAAGDSLLTIDKVDVVRLVVDVPEASAPRVHAGTPASITVSSLTDEAIHARITRTALAIRQDTRTMRAEIDLDNRDGRLLPGLYARVLLDLSTPQPPQPEARP
jgi:HlyD family secretion protein